MSVCPLSSDTQGHFAVALLSFSAKGWNGAQRMGWCSFPFKGKVGMGMGHRARNSDRHPVTQGTVFPSVLSLPFAVPTVTTVMGKARYPLVGHDRHARGVPHTWQKFADAIIDAPQPL